MAQPRALAPAPNASTQGRILSLLITEGPLHRAALARGLELSKSRVTGVVNELIHEGTLVEVDLPPDVDGRAGPALAIPPERAAVVGIQINTRGISVHLSTLGGTSLRDERVELPHPLRDADEATSIVQRLFSSVMASCPTTHVITAGVGFFGRIDSETGEARTHPGQPWSAVRIGELAEEAIGVPTVVENNTRLEALAESQWGAGRGRHLSIYLHLSAGLTSTTVIDGHPLSGARGGAGEIGHVSVDPSGPICNCGQRGCLQTYASSTSIQAALGVSSFTDAVAAFHNGNPVAERVFSEAFDAIGRASAALAAFVEPELIIIGGDYAKLGASLDEVRRSHIQHLYSGVTPAEFTVANFGGGGPGGAQAAALLARRHVAQELLAERISLRGQAPSVQKTP